MNQSIQEELKQLTQRLAELTGVCFTQNGAAAPSDALQLNRNTQKTLCLKLTPKEIQKMPERFKREFMIGDYCVHCRKRIRGKHSISYEIRYRKNGYNISVTSKFLEVCKEKFVNAICALQKPDDPCTSLVPTQMDQFTQFYFNTYRRRKVTAQTLYHDLNRYKLHIQPYIGNMSIKKITPAHCQRLLDRISDNGYFKTNNEVASLLNCIFKMAIAHDVITKNPMAVVIVDKHFCKHGTPLTVIEEQQLFEGVAGTDYEVRFAVMLYTGIRPNECYTVQKVSDQMLKAKNSKRKNGQYEEKRIPIIDKLKPYLKQLENLTFPELKYLRAKFNEILPNHKLYDMRHTFYTRCDECGVAPVARDEMVGHSTGRRHDTYSHISDEYLIKEAQKLSEWQ